VERVDWMGEGVGVEESGLSEEEESVIREKLRRLGYIE